MQNARARLTGTKSGLYRLDIIREWSGSPRPGRSGFVNTQAGVPKKAYAATHAPLRQPATADADQLVDSAAGKEITVSPSGPSFSAPLVDG